MPSILIAHGTTTRQTATVAALMADALAERGFDVTVTDLVHGTDEDPSTFDAILVGTAVTAQAHPPAVVAFVERHAETLGDRPSGLFQLSLAPPVPWRSVTSEAGTDTDTLLEATGWEPDRIGRFAGRLPASTVPWPTRLLVEVAGLTGRLGSDPTAGEEGTGESPGESIDEAIDRDAVEDFAVTFGEYVEIERSRAADAAAAEPGRGGGSRLRRAALALGALGLAGGALWAWRTRDEVGDGDALTVEGEPEDEPDKDSRPSPVIDGEDLEAVAGEPIDVDQD